MSLTLQFVPYSEIEGLGSAKRVHKLIDKVKENKIVLLEGRLKREEEADLIEIAMEEVDNKFKGIELAVIDPKKEKAGFFSSIKSSMTNMLLGDRQGFTIIGPATVVKEIKNDPDKIELFTNENKRKKSSKKKR